ncbi:MFS transporter [Adhaeribacter soli]|uniref:MFS transporter n=1 Tax=Adhaeribacter soli TaxID=2607655 RepID=A0A5N1IPH8_9BACT|nr:MFS transporter [Adhaeribacter soli]KAA9331914.1 MFS transporter [Adhaeribacter soli]
MAEDFNTNRSVILNTAVIVAALGYFVDIYDLILFSVVRVQSLSDLGISAAENLDKGVLLINMQMAGMLIGGILWGILGDKRGRLTVLFGSILLYSLANIANGFVQNIEQYALLRFIAGVGLAGELGAGVTLVSEVLPKEKRGLGTMIVATVGVSGALLAFWVGDFFGWRNAYFIGGGLGLLLLFLRVSVYESGMFKNLKEASVTRGDFFSLFTNGPRLKKYLMCILVGIPLWYVIGILITFSPEFGKSLGVQGEVSAGKAVFYSYFGLIFGDFLSGYLSQVLKSRNKVMVIFLLSSAAMITVYFLSKGVELNIFYFVCFGLGITSGFWAVFVTIAAEQFGTNLRATVATTVPNFVRGSVVPMTLAFNAMRPSVGLQTSAIILAAISIVLALFSISQLKESFGKDLDYYE